MTTVRVATAQILSIGFGKGQAMLEMTSVRVATAQILSIGCAEG
jgi:hypothetical protein